MQAIIYSGKGGPEVLTLAQLPDPIPGPHELLVQVGAAALNRADILQRKGLYPPPPGESTIPGLEMAGEILACGDQVSRFKVGDRVFGLVAGGAYASLCLLDERLAMATPAHWSDIQAAAISECFFTANETLFKLGGLVAGETVLIHAGGSGVGSSAIQLAQHVGARVLTSTRSPEKVAGCKALGADHVANDSSTPFDQDILEVTKGRGVHLILDFVGAAYFKKNMNCLASQGRLVMIGRLGGTRAELDLSQILTRRLKLMGFIMRSQSIAEKQAIRIRFEEFCLPLLSSGQLQILIHQSLPLEQAAEGHRLMESSSHFGKIVLQGFAH